MDERLSKLIADVLEVPPGSIRPDLLRRETDAWDSMNHLRLVTAIESEFAVTLTMEEIELAQTPSDLARAIAEARRRRKGR